MSCAQIIGNPVSAPDPAESPANAALFLSKPRRETLCLCGPNFLADIHQSLSLYLTEGLSLAGYAARRIPSLRRINAKCAW
jgi:hypothetical protein